MNGQTFYLTFGQRGLRDGFVTILARDYDDARGFVVDEYGQRWSCLYTEEDWDPSYFPAGSFGTVRVST